MLWVDALGEALSFNSPEPTRQATRILIDNRVAGLHSSKLQCRWHQSQAYSVDNIYDR